MDEQFQEIAESEWSYFFNVEELSKKPEQLTISPNEDERKRLENRLGLVKIEKLEANLNITQSSGSMTVHIKGQIEADLIQSCVVTLENVHSSVSEEFEAWYADPDAAVSLAKVKHEKESKAGQGEVRMLEEEDDPEYIVDGKIDLGELVTQYLSLAINPYPHAEGVEPADYADKMSSEDDGITNPFAALKGWKDQLTNKE